jgi:hypothetical protein
MSQWIESINKLETMIESCTNVIKEKHGISSDTKRLAKMFKEDCLELLIMMGPTNDRAK